MKQDRLFLTAGFMPAVVMAAFLLLESLLQNGVLPQNIWILAAAEVAVYLVPMAVLRFLPNSEGKRARFRFKGYKRQTVPFVLWMSLAASLLAALLNSAVSSLLGQASSSGWNASAGISGVWWQALLVAVLLPAVVEELFFRGVLFSALESCGTWPALILSSAAFAMIHGDLHTGSIFINEETTMVFDPEFCFYGPMGYDIGNVIANMIFAWCNGDVAGDKEFCAWVESVLVDVIDMTMAKMRAYYDEHVTDTMCKNKAYEDYYMGTILADTSAVSGLEMIRRIVGMANVKDITTIADEAKRARAEKICITAGIDFIKNRDQKKCGKCFLAVLKDAVAAVDAQ